MPQISQHYLQLEQRSVYYLKAGSGPILVMLHGSPQSARALRPIIDVFARTFTCIAFDTPGNGLSDPLTTTNPSADDYAASLLACFNALNIKRPALYGFHTGAGTAMSFIKHYPDRASCLVADGYAVWNDLERAEFLQHYLPEMPLSWDGSHLTWLWSRIEEQTVFFPWYQPKAKARMDYTVPLNQHLHQNVEDILMAGDHYRAVYASAFKRRGEAGLQNLSQVPVLIAANTADPLYPHLDRLPELPDNFTIERHEQDRPTTLQRYADYIGEHMQCTPQKSPTFTSNNLNKGFVEIDRGLQLLYSSSQNHQGRPLLLLHDAGCSHKMFLPYFSPLGQQRNIIAIDLPCHGDSRLNWSTSPYSVEDYAEYVGLALKQLGVEQPAVLGIGLGGQIGLRLKAQGKAYESGIIGIANWSKESLKASRIDQTQLPSISPEWDGSHLLRAWKISRWQCLFYPWFMQDAQHRIDEYQQLQLDRLQQRCIDLIKAGNHYRDAYNTQLNDDTAKLINQYQPKLFSLASVPSSSSADFQKLAKDCGTQTPYPLSDDPDIWVDYFAAWER